SAHALFSLLNVLCIINCPSILTPDQAIPCILRPILFRTAVVHSSVAPWPEFLIQQAFPAPASTMPAAISISTFPKPSVKARQPEAPNPGHHGNLRQSGRPVGSAQKYVSSFGSHG
ncbi:hypothetical protein CLAIMM_03546, partial [Cladophialophora immunda]